MCSRINAGKPSRQSIHKAGRLSQVTSRSAHINVNRCDWTLPEAPALTGAITLAPVPGKLRLHARAALTFAPHRLDPRPHLVWVIPVAFAQEK